MEYKPKRQQQKFSRQLVFHSIIQKYECMYSLKQVLKVCKFTKISAKKRIVNVYLSISLSLELAESLNSNEIGAHIRMYVHVYLSVFSK